MICKCLSVRPCYCIDKHVNESNISLQWGYDIHLHVLYKKRHIYILSKYNLMNFFCAMTRILSSRFYCVFMKSFMFNSYPLHNIFFIRYTIKKTPLLIWLFKSFHRFLAMVSFSFHGILSIYDTLAKALKKTQLICK